MLKAILPVVRSGYQNILQVKEPIFSQPTRVSQFYQTKNGRFRNVVNLNIISLHTEYIRPQASMGTQTA